jgi:subtilisin family serine protease
VKKPGFSTLVLLAAAGLSTAGTVAAGDATYLVLYRQAGVPKDAAAAVAKAGGVLVQTWDEIGVAVARTSDPSFRTRLRGDSRVEDAAQTSRFGVKLESGFVGAAGASAPSGPDDPLSGLQWDMVQMHVPEAQAVTEGSRSILVGMIDTGIDETHPDLAPNIDFEDSVSCAGGVPNTDPAAWHDIHGHGTHTAGTVAAARNGVGVVGVAPNVRLAAIKAGDADAYFYPEAIVCSFMWAGRHRMDVTSNSYYADPWVFNCKNDPTQRVIWKAEQRAIRYAISRGVTVVAALDNFNLDLAHPTVDPFSPDDGTPVPREVTNACIMIPVEIAGVIGVSAVGALHRKAYYSNYGVGVVDVTAPGGDTRFQVTAAAPNGAVLSTYPAELASEVPPALQVWDCSVSPCAFYVYLQGTSIATPHVSGLAALVKSRFPGISEGALSARLERTADPLPCPPNPFSPGPWQATCEGGAGANGFYGHGEVNALSAVTP